jgi:succinate dehydrogenase hydrophobic anchor subunit
MDNVVKNQTKKATSVDASGFYWLVQVISGTLLILLMALHMVAHHFVVEGGLRTYQDVLDYISNPVVFALEVVFIVVVAPHAMLGLHGILLDLGPGNRAKTTITWIMRILTIVVIGYGIWLALALQAL